MVELGGVRSCQYSLYGKAVAERRPERAGVWCASVEMGLSDADSTSLYGTVDDRSTLWSKGRCQMQAGAREGIAARKCRGGIEWYRFHKLGGLEDDRLTLQRKGRCRIQAGAREGKLARRCMSGNERCRFVPVRFVW